MQKETWVIWIGLCVLKLKNREGNKMSSIFGIPKKKTKREVMEFLRGLNMSQRDLDLALLVLEPYYYDDVPTQERKDGDTYPSLPSLQILYEGDLLI